MVSGRLTHPLWVRLTHWVNALAFLVMVTSGWRIYNASPVFRSFRIPESITLGGWLGGALLWHFAAMWLLMANGLLYLSLGIASGRFRRQLFPLKLSDLWRDFVATIRGRLSHDDISHFNSIQKLAYLFAITTGILIVLSGLVVYKSVQFPLLTKLMMGYDNARIVHFACMAALMLFLLIHVVAALTVPKTVVAMIRGHE
jgi:thiosulfate reductase cytochrome b subunit